jgi:hypothetical protein
LESEMFLKPDGGLAGYRISMNRFLLIPKPKPEFKLAQPLPPLLGLPPAGNHFTRTPPAAAFCWKHIDSPTLFQQPSPETLTACHRDPAA